MKLVCLICGTEEKIPLHCGKPMSYIQKGNFRKRDFLKCEICGTELEMPRHCNVPMLYVDEDYMPIYKLSKSEIEELKRIYGE
ncbi:hypothetical protein D1867_07420 [Acidianus infernus]|uniref:Uncharacterized protein n=1 Tax=Acidianus infernus TaxID=12915 RepID=A0A6A9QE53_ACIIN|nr:hypothetical protein [Acidianus infernus]MUM65069.1 hypothetical protein [Acidianus infernus]